MQNLLPEATPRANGRGAAHRAGWTVALFLMTTFATLSPACAQNGAVDKPAPAARKLSAQVIMTRESFNGWNDAYKLSNGTAEVVIVPQIGRIMRFGFVGAPNLLWTNDAESGKPGVATGGWRNFGGDKPWPWSQDDWTKWFGADWPPPPEADQLPQTVTLVGTGTVRLVSPTIPKIGCRIVREITLAETGARLFITTHLERVTDANTDPVSAWTITQTPFTRTPLVAHLDTSGTTFAEGWRVMGDKQPVKSVKRSDDGVLLMVERDPEAKGGRKLGFDGDSITGVIGDTLLTIRADSPGAKNFDWRPGERGQIYISDAGAPYIEWEFTSPLIALKKGESATLHTTFEAVRLPMDISAMPAMEAAARGSQSKGKKQ
ncbi:MAG: hypothetical protein H7Y38_15610 [Armatimonadetes bacterium]|nr:hypothetical protein [Armatimonadota bacterium]